MGIEHPFDSAVRSVMVLPASKVFMELRIESLVSVGQRENEK